MFFKKKGYSLRKCRQFFKERYAWYKKKGGTLSEEKRKALENDLEALDQAIIAKDRAKANEYVKHLDSFGKIHMKKSFLDVSLELVVALAFALAIAVVVRQMWFELMEIPTGSMRPTFKEKDRLTVTKTTFGLNIPFQPGQFYFDPDLVERGGIFIFSGADMPIHDNQGNYFYIFPAYKRYVKRLMGKPGDSIYFYGGKLYGVDKEGNPIKEILDSPGLEKLDHIPMIDFQGRGENQKKEQFVFRQMNQPAGRVTIFPSLHEIKFEIYNGKKWVKDQPTNEPHDQIKTYSDLYGMRNFAMARLLTEKQLEEFPDLDKSQLGEGVLYLELSHHPSLTYPRISLVPTDKGFLAFLDPQKSIIPLQKEHLDSIMDAMYTARFEIENNRASNYDVGNGSKGSFNPTFEQIPDGRYEFYYGKANSVNWAGMTSPLPENHPLYSRDPANIQKLFNLGIQFHTALNPSPNDSLFPHRYAYFRDGDLYLMGAPILKKDDPTLIAFVEREKEKQERSSTNRPYLPFKDYGPPLKEDGTYDVKFIRTFGVTVPEKHYLGLGDNHAMSGDSRDFGFIPQENIEGTPSLIMWPADKRFGPPAQKAYPFMNTPRAIVWTIALIAFIIYWVIHRRNMQKPMFKRKKFK